MVDRSLDELGSLQRRVMEALWELGEGTVAEVRQALPRKDRGAYTTVLTVLQKLEQLDWVTHRREGRAYVYAPAASRQEMEGHSLQRFVQRVFDGDPLSLFEHLLEDEAIGPDELARLRKLIDARRRRKEKDDA